MNARAVAGARVRVLPAVVVAVVLAGLLAACGGDDEAPTGSETTNAPGESAPTESTATTTPVPTGPTGPVDAGELLAATGDAPAARGAGLSEPPGDPDRTPLPGFAETAAALVAPDGTATPLCLLLALVQEQRNRGLMEVTDLGGYAGMLFAWDVDNTSSFYMRNTPMPLTIGWFGADGELVSTADMEPCDNVDGCPLYSATGPYRFALEVPQGELERLGVGEGTRLRVGGSCSAASP